MTQVARIPFDNSYVRLPKQFYSPQVPSIVTAPSLIRVNHDLAQELGIDVNWLQSEDGLQVLAGNQVLDNSDPIATVYAGHQFGGWNPQLGDGRAVLLGEVISKKNELRYDVQLKGAGKTPYSRGGDGRSPLGPVLREYIVSEAMTALGVPSTRSLAAVTTGEPVVRETLLPGGVLTRVAQSHIRIGTFQFFSARQDLPAVKTLADYVIERHYPVAAQAENPYQALLEGVIFNQAKLIAKWQGLGFIHGVMNTDNMLLCGETVDYGPCAFMDTYHPDTVFSSIDQNGRYAYANQPRIAQWNLSWLAQALVPLLDKDEAKAIHLAENAVNGFAQIYQDVYATEMNTKLGFRLSSKDSELLVQNLLDLMLKEQSDFTLTFRTLTEQLVPGQCVAGVNDFYTLPDSFSTWITQWRKQLSAAGLDLAEVQRVLLANNPVYIPRNHLIEEVIQTAIKYNDFSPFNKMVTRLEKPFDYDSENARAAQGPRSDEVVHNTFCGT